MAAAATPWLVSRRHPERGSCGVTAPTHQTVAPVPACPALRCRGLSQALWPLACQTPAEAAR